MTNGVEQISGNHALTFDEKKAAEAAFRGLSADPTWSRGAQAIYEGIVARTQGRNIVEETMLFQTTVS